MKHNVNGLGEGNEYADSVLANYLSELKLRHPTSIRPVLELTLSLISFNFLRLKGMNVG